MSDAITPIHVRSAYSFLARSTAPAAGGTAMPGELVQIARAAGHSHLAITDTNCLAGAPAFHKLAVEAGLQPIIGAELVEEGGAPLVTLIAEETGYSNLCRLITRGDGSALGELQEGLLFLTEDAAAARRLAGVLDRRRLWLGIDPATQSSSQLRRLLECAEELGLPLAATGKALLARKGDADLARLMAAIRLGKTFEAIGEEEMPHGGAFLRGPEELARQLADFPQAVTNNRRLVEMCANFRLLPRKPVFPRFEVPGGQAPAEFLRRLCRVGMRTRYGCRPPEGATDRLEKELDLIVRMGFCEYFLVIWDIVRYARSRHTPVAGRGSGASSLVAYLLGVTNVCPLRYRIPFERFLHEGREDYPDLDIDFCWRLRDEVIDYVFRRWGVGRAAMVCMHNTFQERSALRETAKAFGFSDEQISEGVAMEEEKKKKKKKKGKKKQKTEAVHGLHRLHG